jgi:hypothetical protein
MAKSINAASTDAQPIPHDVLLHELSELLSLRERVEQAELAANVYGESIVRRRRIPPKA